MDGTIVKVYASAILIFQILENKHGIPASTMTCSIDARWAPGESVGPDLQVPVLDPHYLRKPSRQNPGYDEAAGFLPRAPLPRDDASWDFISLDVGWLHTLTSIAEHSGKNRTTLAVLFESIRLINGTSRISDSIEKVHNVVANVVATLVTDGISRIRSHHHPGQPKENNGTIDPHEYRAFFSGDKSNVLYTYPPPHWTDAANHAPLKWRVTLSGLAYTTNEYGSQTTLALLFIYTAMVLAHMTWCISTGFSSKAWNSLVELMALAKNSPPTGVWQTQVPRLRTVGRGKRG